MDFASSSAFTGLGISALEREDSAFTTSLGAEPRTMRPASTMACVNWSRTCDAMKSLAAVRRSSHSKLGAATSRP